MTYVLPEPRPMLDHHTARVEQCLRAVIHWRSGAIDWVAVSTPERMARWLLLASPVHCLCRVAVRDGRDEVTREDRRTLSGLELATLYTTGRLELERCEVELVAEWPTSDPQVSRG